MRCAENGVRFEYQVLGGLDYTILPRVDRRVAEYSYAGPSSLNHDNLRPKTHSPSDRNGVEASASVHRPEAASRIAVCAHSAYDPAIPGTAYPLPAGTFAIDLANTVHMAPLDPCVQIGLLTTS